MHSVFVWARLLTKFRTWWPLICFGHFLAVAVSPKSAGAHHWHKSEAPKAWRKQRRSMIFDDVSWWTRREGIKNSKPRCTRIICKWDTLWLWPLNQTSSTGVVVAFYLSKSVNNISGKQFTKALRLSRWSHLESCHTITPKKFKMLQQKRKLEAQKGSFDVSDVYTVICDYGICEIFTFRYRGFLEMMPVFNSQIIFWCFSPTSDTKVQLENQTISFQILNLKV